MMSNRNRRRRSCFAAASFVLSGISVAGVGASSYYPPPAASHVTAAQAPTHGVGRSLGGYCRSSSHVPFLLKIRGGSNNDEDEDDSSSSDGEDNVEEDEDWRRDLPQSPYDYVSPSALDSYGGSPQIRNAHEAAVGPYGGTIVVAAVATGSKYSPRGNEYDACNQDNCNTNNNNYASVICCSLRRVRKGLRSSRLGKADGDGGSRTVHVVSCEDSVPELVDDVTSTTATSAPANSIVALAASGLKPDLNLLLALIRTRSVEVWDRYDVPPGPVDVAESISQAFLSFLGYDRDKEAGDGIGPLRDDSNAGDGGKDGKFQMSRPFGLDVIVLGAGWNGGHGSVASGHDINGCSILSVGPSGVIRGPFVAHAVGRGHELANDLLKESWAAGMDEASVRALCIDAIRRVAEEEMGIALNGDSDEEEGASATKSLDGWEIVCETMSAAGGPRGGIHSTRYPLAR